ncbi:ras GEF [Tricholoma matsutake]|nr:ras GEF [Tricholoma matsutake 945]
MHSNHRHSFLPQTHTATTSTASQQQPVAWQQQQDQALPEDQFTTLFCRALYDYDAQDASALSFRRNDIIEVLSQEPSGWWDGLLGDERGWFPSNYVDVISEEELSFLGSEFSSGELRQSVAVDSQSAMVDISHAIMRGTNQAENEEWLNAEMSFRTDALNSIGMHVDGSGQSSDFWMPQITADSQIYYVNTRTGQESRDLPQEANDDISDSELAGLASQSNSRSGTNAGLAFGPHGTSEPFANGHGIAGFGVSRRTGTPEPWIRKLADDGMSYLYYNKIDGQVQWTRPEVHTSHDHTASHLPPSLPPTAQRTNGRRDSVYSDDSDVQPSGLVHRLGPQLPDGRTSETREHLSSPIQGDGSAVDFSSGERMAQSLQQTLSPPPPELITELSAVAKGAIQGLVRNIQLHGFARRPEDDHVLDDLLNGVVSVVRNLLYASAVPTAQIPANVLPQEVRDTAAPSIQPPLKSAHRKVTATLSRLVLSARAIQYDSGSLIADTLSRIEVDAEELERAVLSFVLEIQRMQHTEFLGKSLKRLHGVFLPTNLGLGLVGAGAAGRWKGFGWVHIDQPPSEARKVFNPMVISDMNSRLTSIDEQFKNLVRALQMSEDSVEQLRLHGREAVARVSSLLGFAADIHVARHVDIDGIGQEASASSTDYMHTVDNARVLVRTLEAVFQSIYDDCSVLLLTVQSVRDSDPSQEKSYAYEYIDALSSSLSSNLRLVVQTLDSLLSVGHDQAEMALGEYTGSIDWRMSRISTRHLVDSAAIHGAEALAVRDAFGNHNGKMPEGESSYQSHNRSISNGLEGHNSFGDFTEETLVEENQPDSVIRDANSSTFFEDDPVPNKTPPRGSKKLARLLGEEYEEQVVAADLRPWYLRSNFNPSEILIDTDRSVKGGTLPALVERLTAHEAADTTYIAYTKAFLMTYKSFTTVDELFDLLVERFRIQLPANMTTSERDNWAKHKQHIIQTRVLNTFKSMVTDEDILEKDDLHILDRMKVFVASEEVSRFGAAKPLTAQIERAQRGGDTTVKTITNLGPPPPPIMPRTNRKLKLTDIEPVELARQLTIMESNLYQKIRPLECLQRAREQKTESMDNIAFVIQTSNRIADWVAESVLNKEDSRKRANIVKHLIGVADRCRTMNNFSTMIAITSGLNTPPIRRLKRTWEQVNQRCMAQFGACEMTIDSSKTYAKYSQLMASVTPPCVPFIGVFLSTLQFIQDGNPDILPGGLINFQKRQMASKVIDDIKRWQATTFNFQAIPAIQTWIEESLNQFNDTRASSEHFWALSLEREPREREDEKMARLLQESGFL